MTIAIKDRDTLILLDELRTSTGKEVGYILREVARQEPEPIRKEREADEREGGAGDLDVLLTQARVQVVTVDQAQADAAHDGFPRFGKGRPPVALNLGDLLAYGSARVTGEPLLFKGDDFARTDLRPA